MLTKYYSGDQIEKNEMGWPCGTYVCVCVCVCVCGGTVWQGHLIEGGKIGIHKRVGWEDVGWTKVAQDRDGQRAVTGT